MSCCDGPNACKCQKLQVLARFEADGTCSELVLHPGHNRFRVWTSPDARVVGGALDLFLRTEVPDARGTFAQAKVGAIAYSADGGSLVGHMSPQVSHAILARCAGFVGADALLVLVESWQESMS